MEAEDHLAREYVQEFVLDHLDPADVKREVRMGSPTMMVNGSVVQLTGQVQSQGLTLAPLTPPAHELEQPLYGQPHIQVQHGVLVKAPPGAAAHLTTLSHPGTPPDTPPVSASPPPLQLHRGDRDSSRDARDLRDRGGILLQLQQPSALVQEEMQVSTGGMGWLTQSLRQEPLDLRPHCPQEQPEPHHEPWSTTPAHHHFQELQHLPRPTRHTGGYLTMSSHLEYYNGPGPGGGMLPAGGVMQGMEDSMQGLSIQPGRPLSVCSVSSCSAGGPTPVHRSGNGLYSNCNGTNPQDELMDDELLMSLSVRELNKRLHGCPREQNELQRTKIELTRIQQERDLYKQRYDMLRTRQNHHHNHSHNHHQQQMTQQQQQHQTQSQQSHSQQQQQQQQQPQHQPAPASPEVYL
ncbi:transcription factor MafB isoform X3 [Cardiocondyla obscurior]|uniref:transcription factor MafB isoform X3 n=1 Tax=Cardiocondyla obscurior TaxID=286306 RepID=UPI0039657B99